MSGQGIKMPLQEQRGAERAQATFLVYTPAAYQKFFRYALRPCSSFILCASKLVLGSHSPASSSTLHQQSMAGLLHKLLLKAALLYYPA